MAIYKNKIYASYQSEFKKYVVSVDVEFLAKKFIPIIKPWVIKLDRALPIVDLGCGAGELLWAFKSLGFCNLHGCDISEEQVEIARVNFPKVKTADLFDFLQEFPDGSIGIITVFDVIEHLGPQRTFDLFDVIQSKLTRGGLIIAHLPNGLSPFVGQDYWNDMTHEWCLTPLTAQTLCRLHGLDTFEACEHLGASDSLKGQMRRLFWAVIKAGLKSINMVEIGRAGGDIWTRNFAFKAEKAANLGAPIAGSRHQIEKV